MRFYLFICLVVVALGLDLLLLGLGLQRPEARLFQAPQARAAPRATAAPTATARPSPTATITPSPTVTPSPTASPTATPSPTAAPSPTATPIPAQLLAAKAVSFTPGDRAVRANIRLALSLGQGALTRVLVPPGGVFSFNAMLGPRPQRLPWKYVVVQPTAVPGEPAPAEVQRIQGGGLCDLASRFVMAARPLLPAKAFRFVNHVRSNGVRLRGVPTRDTVSIWAVGGGPGEQDLTISNPTERWLEFTVDRAGERITVTAQLWDRAPGGSSR